jgi:hypothetical protein
MEEDELRQLVTTHLGRDPFRADAGRRVAILIVKAEAGFEGRIVWADSSGRSFGERRLDSRNPNCREIGANVAFAVAVQVQLIDLGASHDNLDDRGTSPPQAQPAPDPSSTEGRPSEADASLRAPGGATPESPPPRMAIVIGAGPALALGLAPQAATVGRLFLAARFGQLSAEVAADRVLSVTQSQPDGSAIVVGADGLSLAACGHASLLSMCLLGRRGWLRARGTGVDEPSGSSAAFNEVGLRVAMTRTLRRLEIGLHVDGLVMLSRWQVVLNDAVVWSTPRFGALVGLDVGVRIF